MTLTLTALDPDRRRRGQFKKAGVASAIFRDADVGTWLINVPHDDLAKQMRDGWRLLLRDGKTRMSGPITEVSPELDDGTVDISGVSDLIHVADRLVYPDPTRAGDQQTAAAYFKRTGPAAEVIDNMVYRNAMKGALPDRRVSGLTMAVKSGGGLGSKVSANLRFKNLLESSRALARLGGVTFDAVQESGSTDIIFRFYVPRDRTKWVRFSDGNGGVSGGRYTLAAPTATNVLVAGQGEGADRTVIERSRASTWGRRIEIFKDQRDTDDAAELEQSAVEQLDEGMAGATASFDVNEAKGFVFGEDYRLGDTVAVEVGGIIIHEPVREVELEWDGFGRTASVVLGDHDQADDKTEAWVKKYRELDARLRGVETI